MEQVMPSVSKPRYSVDVSGPATVIGQRIIYVVEYSDGNRVVQKEKFIPVTPEESTLLDIWSGDHENKYSVFITEAVRNGLVNEHTMTWLHGSVSLRCCYEYLSSTGLVRSYLRWTEVYRAFSGTFTLTKIKHARSLQYRSNTTHAFRSKEKYWKHFFDERFSLNRERKNKH